MKDKILKDAKASGFEIIGSQVISDTFHTNITEKLTKFAGLQTQRSLNDKLLEDALQQFIGFLTATQGFSVIELIKGMGLSKDEFNKIKDDVYVPPYLDELNKYFKEGHAMNEKAIRDERGFILMTDENYLLLEIAKIREVTGLGNKPMLCELGEEIRKIMLKQNIAMECLEQIATMPRKTRERNLANAALKFIANLW